MNCGDMKQNPLAKYLESRSESQADFAKRAELSRSYVCEILNGTRVPGRSVIARINEATGGVVPPAVWFPALDREIAP